MSLNILVLVTILFDGSVKGEFLVVEKCPEPEKFIEQMEQKLFSGKFAGWSAKCTEFTFVPVDLENQT